MTTTTLTFNFTYDYDLYETSSKLFTIVLSNILNAVAWVIIIMAASFLAKFHRHMHGRHKFYANQIKVIITTIH